MSERVRYLSLQWIDELTKAVADDGDLASGWPPATRSASRRSSPTVPRATSRTTSRSTTARPASAPAPPSPSTSAWSRLGDRGRRRHRRAQRPGGVRQRPHPAVRRPAAAARRAARVRRPRRRVHRRPPADRVRLRSPCPSCPRSRPTPSGSTADFAGRRLRRFVPLTFTALKTAAPAPDDGVRAAAAGRRPARQVPARAVRAGHVRRPPDAGRAAPRRRQAVGQAARRPGPLRASTATARRCCSPSRAPSAGPACGACPTGRRRSTAPPLDRLGPEADHDRARRAGRAASPRKSMRLHGFLRDQRSIAGLGRRLANEVCHRAKLSPFAMTGKLGLDGATTVVDGDPRGRRRGPGVRAHAATT